MQQTRSLSNTCVNNCHKFMAEDIDVSPASVKDIPTFAAIWTVSMKINPVMNFIFPNQIYDASAPYEYIRHVYEHASRQAGYQFVKATSKTTGETVGYCGFRKVEGSTEGVDERKNAVEPHHEKDLKPQHPLPYNTDMDLYDEYFRGRARKESMHMAGQRYAGMSLCPPHPLSSRNLIE